MPSYAQTILAVVDQLERGVRLCGTAFSVGPRLFATAGHVVEGVRTGRAPQLVRLALGSEPVRAFPITGSLLCSAIDFGMLEADYEPSDYLPWVACELPAPNDVWTTGFAHGYEPERHALVHRWFKGHITNLLRYERWAQMDFSRQAAPQWPFDSYHLSFAWPLGLSGAPLLVEYVPTRTSVCGIVVGNTKSSMLVHDSTERTSGTEVVRTERYVELHLGEALTSGSLVGRPDARDPDAAVKHRLQEAIGGVVG